MAARKPAPPKFSKKMPYFYWKNVIFTCSNNECIKCVVNYVVVGGVAGRIPRG
jgi:hypothetical protein